MTLPIIPRLEFTLKLPISNKEIVYKPYSVAEEKILLSIATTKSSDPFFYSRNLKTVLNNCITLSDGSVGDLPAIEVDLIMLHLRGKSVGEIIDARYVDSTGTKRDVSLSVEDFRIDVPEDHKYRIELTDKIGLIMRDLSFDQRIGYSAKFNEETKAEAIFESIVDSIQSIYDENNVYVVGIDTTREEVVKFVESLQGKSAELYKFVSTMPRLVVDAFDINSNQTITLASDEIDFL